MCNHSKIAAGGITEKSTLSNYTKVRVGHIDISDLDVDFTSQTLSGRASYQCKVLSPVVELVLDCKDLEISSVLVAGENVNFTLADRVEPFGTALHVPIGTRAVGDELMVTVTFKSTKDASALQWLEPAQTAGKTHPYLFTQCQAIHARTMIPCQDTPMVKATYTAKVTVPEALTAVMSALATGDGPVASEDKPGCRTFSFSQPVPIPSYLIALAVGDLASREIGPRSRVYAEPSVVESAAWEFAQTEDFIAAGEGLLGPYVWGRYDILMLPPSFPYGGMENPCLTFVTPTLIAADRSLADVVAHEIAHSWTGNLVTNATWESFWLNEGFTMMVERKILGKLQGEGAFQFDAFSGAFALRESIAGFMARGQEEFTKLIPDLSGIDPDDAFSSVPYEKGFYLLYYLQTVVGKEPFEAFLHDYIQTFKYKSITAQDFKGYFCAYFTEGRHTLPRVSHSGIPPSHTGAAGPTDRHDSADIPSLAVPNDGELGVPAVHGVDEAAVAAAKAHAIDVSSVDWDTWFYAPGQPPVTNQYDASERGAVDAHADAWVADAVSAAATAKDVTHEWHTHHRIAFLERLVSKSDELAAASPAATFSPMLLKGIDSAFSFSGSRNSEIRLLWSKLAIRSGMVEILPSVIDFLKSQGRMKYTRPLFRELLKSSFGRAPALELYAAHKGAYHPICAKMVGVDIQQETAKPAVDAAALVQVGGSKADAATDGDAAPQRSLDSVATVDNEAAAEVAAALASAGATGAEQEDEEDEEEDEEGDDEEEDEEEEEEASASQSKKKSRGFGVSVKKVQSAAEAKARKQHERMIAMLRGQPAAAGAGTGLMQEEDDDEEEEDGDEAAEEEEEEEESDDDSGVKVVDVPQSGSAAAVAKSGAGAAGGKSPIASAATFTAEKKAAAEAKREEIRQAKKVALAEIVAENDLAGSSSSSVSLAGIGSAVMEKLQAVEVSIGFAETASTVAAVAVLGAAAAGALYVMTRLRQ